MRHLLFVILFFFSVGLMAQVNGKVVDAETGETLPYVTVRVDQQRGTITNREGMFIIDADEGERLTFSCTGFTAVSYQVGNVPKVVRLKPMDFTMQTVTVVPWENILVKVGKRWFKDLSRHKRKKSKYFFRMTNQMRRTELVEGLLEARSTCSLREILFLRGRRGQLTQQGMMRPLISSMNFHHPLELGVAIDNPEGFWHSAYFPMNDGNTFDVLKRRYDVHGKEMTDSTGRKIYRIELARKPKVTDRLILTGVLYVDAKTLRPLRFDGQVENMLLEIKQDLRMVTTPIAVAVHIDYTQRKGYTEVDNMSVQIENGDLKNRMLLFNVDEMPLDRIRGQKTLNDNMLATIDRAGDDATIWAKDEIVARTPEEQMLSQNEEKGILVPSDDIDAMVQRLGAFGQRIPQEKVYLHMDNTSYFVGDTIWFAAYTRQTDTGMPSRISGVLYVELLNNDGYLMERKLIEMKDGRGHGNFVLGKDAYGGFYELRAYTRWQLNWGITQRKHSSNMRGLFLNTDFEDLFYRDYDKLYSRVFPVYDEPASPGVYAENMTLRTLRRTFKDDPDAPHLTLTLYPEGGELVEGVESAIAFEACWSDGRTAEGILNVGDAQFMTENRGRGTFAYTPGGKHKPEVRFVDSEGNVVEAKIPDAVRQGAAMHLWQTDSCWRMRLTLGEGMLADSMAWTVMHEGRLQCHGRLDGNGSEIALPGDLPAGVNQATLFDNRGRVWADRLFFVARQPAAGQRLSVTGVKDNYQPYEQIALEVQSELPSAHVSLSVRDGALGDALFDNAGMLTEMLLCSEIKGFVPHPGWFFEQDDEEHRRALDLLMLTQGWRRFVWRDMAVRGAWDLTQPDEPAPMITGQVYAVDETPFYGMEAISPSEYRHTAFGDDYNYILNFYDPTYQYGDYVPGVLDDQGMIFEEGEPNYIAINSIFGDDNIAEATEPRDDSGLATRPQRLKNEVLLHAEICSMDGKESLTSEKLTRNGRFQLLLPRAHADYILFLSASDSTQWSKQERQDGHQWIQIMPREQDLPKGYKNRFRIEPSKAAVRVQFPYPRYVKPYDYYQRHIDTAFDPMSVPSELLASDGATLMREVTIKNRRGKFFRLDQSKPAFVIDAYDAYNQALDAGMKNAEPAMVTRALLGTYGQDDPFTRSQRLQALNPHIISTRSSNIKVRYGYDQLSRLQNGITTDADSAYIFSNLRSTGDRGSYETGKYYFHSNKDKYVFYTDYSPRYWGSERYKASHLPETNVGVFMFPEGGRRPMYRDRRYVMQGYSVAEDFYQPDYSKRKPGETPADYRRTLYWNPDLQLDGKGHASVTLWNSGKLSVIHVSAEGVGKEGEIVESR